MVVVSTRASKKLVAISGKIVPLACRSGICHRALDLDQCVANHPANEMRAPHHPARQAGVGETLPVDLGERPIILTGMQPGSRRTVRRTVASASAPPRALSGCAARRYHRRSVACSACIVRDGTDPAVSTVRSDARGARVTSPSERPSGRVPTNQHCKGIRAKTPALAPGVFLQSTVQTRKNRCGPGVLRSGSSRSR
jgi:hypothetical protein